MKPLSALLFPCLTLIASFSSVTAFSAQPVALIYKGLGSCSVEEGDAGKSGYGCSLAAAEIAKKAGLIPRYVTRESLAENASDARVKALFKDAAVWIQPGGYAHVPLTQMSRKLINELKKFIANGGGYVGFCAGAYLATAQPNDPKLPGFGIFAATSEDYDTSLLNRFDYSFEKIKWQGKVRSIFFEGGPYFSHFKKNAAIETIATYSDGSVAAARSTYGKGRVFIVGPHPEAPLIWSQEDGVVDPDGDDHDLAVSMVQWAGKLL